LTCILWSWRRWRLVLYRTEDFISFPFFSFYSFIYYRVAILFFFHREYASIDYPTWENVVKKIVFSLNFLNLNFNEYIYIYIYIYIYYTLSNNTQKYLLVIKKRKKTKVKGKQLGTAVRVGLVLYIGSII